MTEPENLLARWSRRKQQAAKESNAKTPVAERSAQVEGPLPLPKGATTQLTFDIASLPPIDSIVAGTDIRAFLAPGVPSELALAALRKAWVADPAIRDFVGLAEYAWDYNAPNSMPGFGPLEMTDDLRQHVSRILGGSDSENESATVSNDRSQPLPGAPASPREPAEDHLDEPVMQGGAQVACEAICDDALLSKSAPVVSNSDSEKVDGMNPGAQRRQIRRHGRALPK